MDIGFMPKHFGGSLLRFTVEQEVPFVDVSGKRDSENGLGERVDIYKALKSDFGPPFWY